ncbi:MAG: S8 family serine peptidase, partial [Clostridia bacterium]|nr:S8 family serine peptidase [Clostridia bacterium]
MMDINTNFNEIASNFVLPPISSGRLEVIVKYVNDISIYSNDFESIEILDNNFAIITGTAEQIRNIYSYTNIIYAELPKTLTYELSFSRSFVCATKAQQSPFSLTGKGVAIGIIDSGIDYTHPDFKNNDNTSRILYIWDQTEDGNAPNGFRSGTEYTKAMLDSALESDNPYSIVNFRDEIGHGTAVAGISCGNGNSSDGKNKGIAPESLIIAVKLGRRGSGAFPRTTEVMRAIKYTIDKAKELNLPLSINLSFGTNNGSHDGNSLFEQYVNDAANEWKCVISVATGNEGTSSHHYSATLQNGQTLNIPFSVSNAPQKIYITLWKNFVDTMYFRLISPTGSQSSTIIPSQSMYSFFLSNTNVTVFCNQPTTYTQYQEIYILMESNGFSIREGL